MYLAFVVSVLLSCLVSRTSYFIYNIRLIPYIISNIGGINDFLTKSFLTILILVYIFIILFTKKYQASDIKFNIVLLSFVIRIIVLTCSSNMLMFFIGWDGLGLTSLWLVFWYKNTKGNLRGWQVFSTMRIGDAFLILSFIFWAYNMVPFMFLNIGVGIFCLVISARTKSAQFPFTSWLPKAIAAPTPVSALVHSSTLVTAGIVLLYRVEIFTSISSLNPLTLVRLLTSLVGGVLRFKEFDIKKRIAYRTLSHCGIIMYGLSLGMCEIVLLHLVLHAFMKSLIFIMAGNSLISFSGNQDIRYLGRSLKVWPLLGLMISRVPFIGIFYTKHAIFVRYNYLINSAIIFLLTLLRVIYIIRLTSLSFSIIRCIKTYVAVSPLWVLTQLRVCFLLFSILEFPIDISFFSPNLYLLGIVSLWVGRNSLPRLETFALDSSEKFMLPFFDKVFIFKGF